MENPYIILLKFWLSEFDESSSVDKLLSIILGKTLGTIGKAVVENYESGTMHNSLDVLKFSISELRKMCDNLESDINKIFH
jgi:hypothetical protein